MTTPQQTIIAQQERRCVPRMAVHDAAIAVHTTDDALRAFSIKDISSHGAALLCPVTEQDVLPLIGSSMDIIISRRAQDAEEPNVMRAAGIVRRIKQAGDHLVIGLEFIHTLAPSLAAVLEDLELNGHRLKAVKIRESRDVQLFLLDLRRYERHAKAIRGEMIINKRRISGRWTVVPAAIRPMIFIPDEKDAAQFFNQGERTGIMYPFHTTFIFRVNELFPHDIEPDKYRCDFPPAFYHVTHRDGERIYVKGSVFLRRQGEKQIITAYIVNMSFGGLALVVSEPCFYVPGEQIIIDHVCIEGEDDKLLAGQVCQISYGNICVQRDNNTAPLERGQGCVEKSSQPLCLFGIHFINTPAENYKKVIEKRLFPHLVKQEDYSSGVLSALMEKSGFFGLGPNSMAVRWDETMAANKLLSAARIPAVHNVIVRRNGVDVGYQGRIRIARKTVLVCHIAHLKDNERPIRFGVDEIMQNTSTCNRFFYVSDYNIKYAMLFMSAIKNFNINFWQYFTEYLNDYSKAHWYTGRHCILQKMPCIDTPFTYSAATAEDILFLTTEEKELTLFFNALDIIDDPYLEKYQQSLSLSNVHCIRKYFKVTYHDQTVTYVIAQNTSHRFNLYNLTNSIIMIPVQSCEISDVELQSFATQLWENEMGSLEDRDFNVIMLNRKLYQWIYTKSDRSRVQPFMPDVGIMVTDTQCFNVFREHASRFFNVRKIYQLCEELCLSK